MQNSVEGKEDGAFYQSLHQELLSDLASVENQEYDLLERAIALGRWEFQYLGHDGSTTEIEEELAKGNDIFWTEEAR